MLIVSCIEQSFDIFQESVTVGNRVANLLSPIVTLEDCFDSLPSGVAEQRRQKDLIRYELFLPCSQRSLPLSKLNVIEEQLRPLSEQQESPLPTDHVQDVCRLLEDLREAILGYQVRSRARV